jgi:hypothetical protein
LVETAIVAPLFFFVIFGLMDASYAFFNRETVDNMSVVGARAGSAQANDPLTDNRILQAVKNGWSGDTDDIDLVVVYRATGPDDRVPTQCLTASVTNTSIARGCNRYVGSDLLLDSNQFGCVGPPGPTVKIDRFWCPTSRKTAVQGRNGPPDYVGVYIKASGQTLIGLIGDLFNLESETVIRIEPRTLT